MKRFLIRYHFSGGSREDWHRDIARFAAAIDSDPATSGKISYFAFKIDGDDYYHLASATDEEASKALERSSFFEPYTKRTGEASGGSVEVLPIEIIAATKYQP